MRSVEMVIMIAAASALIQGCATSAKPVSDQARVDRSDVIQERMHEGTADRAQVEISDEQVRVEVEGFIDPGGLAPSWAINAVQRQAPYYTVLGLQRMVKLPKYSEAKGPLPFNLIQEN